MRSLLKQDTVNELARLFERVLGEPELRAALVMLVGQLCQDKQVFAAIADLATRLSAEEKVTQVSRYMKKCCFLRNA